MIEVGQTILYHVAASDENRFDFGAKAGEVVPGIVTGVNKLGEINCWLFPNTAKMKPVFLEDVQYGTEPGKVSETVRPIALKNYYVEIPLSAEEISGSANPPALTMPETGAGE